MKLLIVEDNSVTAETLGECLRLMGHESEWAADGEAALIKMDAADGRFGAVLLDLYLPGGMDGLEVARRVRTRWAGVPLVMTTAAADWVVDEKRPEIESLGRAALMRKPYSVDELLKVAESLTQT